MHNSVDCHTNCSSQGMPVIGSQLCNRCYTEVYNYTNCLKWSMTGRSKVFCVFSSSMLLGAALQLIMHNHSLYRPNEYTYAATTCHYIATSSTTSTDCTQHAMTTIGGDTPSSVHDHNLHKRHIQCIAQQPELVPHHKC